jgi:DNA-binding response OmpR family regulator
MGERSPKPPLPVAILGAVEGQRTKVLVVEDDEIVRRAIRLTCEREGYAVAEVDRGAPVASRAEAFHPDIVLLDLMLPDTSGFDVCRDLRRRGQQMPILILSAKSEEIDVVLGLEIGADDYILKPFRPRELLARIAAHLRTARERSGGASREGPARLAFRGLVIDLAERRVSRPAGEVNLTHTEFDLLSCLARNAGQVVSRQRIMDAVWGFGHPLDTRVIDVHVRNLRRKIEDDPSHPRYILAVPGVGYRFAGVPATADAAGAGGAAGS